MTYGCYNRTPFVDIVVVQHGWEYFTDSKGTPHRFSVMRAIDNPMSRDCQYSKTTPDAQCAGCTWRHGAR